MVLGGGLRVRQQKKQTLNNKSKQNQANNDTKLLLKLLHVPDYLIIIRININRKATEKQNF